MIKKAPKDMTLGELLEAYKLERRCGTCKYDQYCAGKAACILGRVDERPGCMGGRIWMERQMNEPAPNPFTPDQLAWMRIKQGEGYQYAAMDFDNEVRLFGEKPDNDGTHWNGQSGYIEQSIGLWSWMRGYLSSDDPEPLCFADYAPLEDDHV